MSSLAIMPDTMLYFFAFVLGACWGSFLHVCISRIPAGESVMRPPSHCPKCSHYLKWYENIPLLSWLFLRGKCANCNCKIPASYFLFELLMAVLFTTTCYTVILRAEPFANILIYLVLLMLAISSACIDIQHRIIPNKLTYTAIILGLMFAFLQPHYWEVTQHWLGLMYSAASLVISISVMFLFAQICKFLLKKPSLGMGDIKYVGALAACAGPKATILVLLCASLTGTLYGALNILCRDNKKLDSTIPFAPFLGLGTLVWIFFHDTVFTLYGKLLQFFI